MRQQHETRRGLGTTLDEDVGRLALVHRQRELVDLERDAVQKILRRDPRRSNTARDEDAHGSEREETADEVLGARFFCDLVVVVENEPGVLGPPRQILREDLGERLDVLGRRRQRAEVSAEPRIAVVDDRGRAARDPERKRSHIGGRSPSREPGRATPVAHDPLLREGRLPVAGGADQHSDTRLGCIEEREQPGSLDDPVLTDPYV